MHKAPFTIKLVKFPRFVAFRALVLVLPLRATVTVAPRYNEPHYNEQHLKARQNYSKICGNKPRYSEPRYNEIPAITK